MSDTYTIKPLKWSRHFDECSQRFSARTTFGSFFVERLREDYDESKRWQEWKWGYCFDEYYDEAYATCDSAEEGKKMAFDLWESRLKEALQAADKATAGEKENE